MGRLFPYTRRVRSAARRGEAGDQLGVAGRQAGLVEADVVLQAGAAVAAELERPVAQLELAAPDAGGGPGGTRQDLLELRHLEPQDLDRKSTRLTYSH